MTTLTLIAAALTLSVSGVPEPAVPAMTVESRGLDLADADQSARFADQVRAASRDFCAQHRALATPRHVNDPGVCERGMRAAALQQLTPEQLRAFTRSGGLERLHRR